MSSAKHIYRIADNHAHTVQVCIDRLHELGANEQLRLLTGRLQKLANRATSGDDDNGCLTFVEELNALLLRIGISNPN